MREYVPEELERGRHRGSDQWGTQQKDGFRGRFVVLAVGSQLTGWPKLLCLSSGDFGSFGPGVPMLARGWEHVSVSRWEFSTFGQRSAIPTWADMARVKDLFWGPEETVVQFHPPASMYVNYHGNVLHLWRSCHGHEVPDPSLVGPMLKGGVRE